LLVSAVIADARNFQIPAITKISAPTRDARAVAATVPADTYTLPLVLLGNTGAQFIDDPRHFVSWNAGILNTGPQAFFREHITVANSTSLHFDAHVSYIQLRNLALNDLKICSWTGNLCHLHCSYRVCEKLLKLLFEPTETSQAAAREFLRRLARRTE